jgi:hypothetical protein
MPTITEVVHPRGLDFQNQRNVVILREQVSATGKQLAFKTIAARVRNLKGKKPSEDVVRRVYERFSVKKGRVQYRFGKCGWKKWKMSADVGKFLIQRLLQKRRKVVCTSTTLQADLYKEKRIKLSTSAIRKHLHSKGYRWRPRSQKRVYDKEDRAVRCSFSGRCKDKSFEAIDKHVTFAMDGVVITVPPFDPMDRLNCCLHGETHMYRKGGEANSPDLAGDDPFADQVPIARALPMWGAISSQGFHELTFHKKKKLNNVEWTGILKSGVVMQAVRALQPGRHVGPRRIICDNETFLDCKPCRAFYKKKNIILMHIPPHSPDLNPIESFWGWLRQTLRRRDLEDLRLKRPPLGKTAYKQRVRSVLRSKKAQSVAKAKFRNFKKVCQTVWKKKGAASGC